MAGVKRELKAQIRKRQFGFLDHILRERLLERDCLLGMVEGRRASGRQRIKFMDGIRQLIGCVMSDEVLRYAEDRRVWRSIVVNINLDRALR